ncbi:MAG: hypothetical protein AAF702_17795 [Chloroflexota bacterium]
MSSLEAHSQDNKQDTLAGKFLKQLKTCGLFGEILSLYLEYTGVRQIELSQRLYVEAATVHNWRKDKRLPDAPMVLRISAALGLTSVQQKTLIDAWRVTRRARELVPCVEEVSKSRDVVTLLSLKAEFSTQLASVRRQIQSAKWSKMYTKTDDAVSYSGLDPDIWLYSGY